MRALEAAKIKVIPTGLKHGTVTAIVDGHTFELTTLRRDVETDGRRAVVAFTDDWLADAGRRDFTFNALYADPDGTLYDPFDGRADLAAGRVRFIGDADQRIAEDRLRVLRFFRFHAWYGRPPLDGPGFDACRRNAGALGALSGERVRQGAAAHARGRALARRHRGDVRSGRARPLAARICRRRPAARSDRARGKGRRLASAGGDPAGEGRRGGDRQAAETLDAGGAAAGSDAGGRAGRRHPSAGRDLPAWHDAVHRSAPARRSGQLAGNR